MTHRRDVKHNLYCTSQDCHKTTQHKYEVKENCYVCQSCGSRKHLRPSARMNPASESGQTFWSWVE
jgi:acetyl-CoA carboxylase beta subunit